MTLRRLALLCALAACVAMAASVLGTVGPAGADLSRRIDSKADRAEYLRSVVAAESAKIRASSAGLARAQRRLRRLQADASAQRAELIEVREQFIRARDRLTRLVKLQRSATGALRANLQAAYRNGEPDIVSVVITARGFTDLLEKTEFLKRIAKRNATIMDVARTSRAQVTRQTVRLAAMQRREQAIATRLERKRESAQAIETALLREREKHLARSNFKRAELRDVQSQLASLREKLARARAAGELLAQRARGHRDEARRAGPAAARGAPGGRPGDRRGQRDRRPALPLRRWPRRLQGHGL